MDHSIDAKQIVTSSLPVDWKRLTSHHVDQNGSKGLGLPQTDMD